MQYRIWGAIAVASFGWGTGGVASRAALLQGVGPLTLTALRAVLAGVAVLGFIIATGRRLPQWRWTARQGVILGLTNLAGPFLFFTLAVQYVSAGFAGLVAALIPAGTAMWAHVLLPAERLHWRKLIGLTVAFLGVALLLFSGESGISGEGRPLLGGGLAVLGMLSASFGGVYGKLHTPGRTVFQLLGAQFISGSLALLVVALALEGMPVSAIEPPEWGLIAYVALLSSFVPFVLFFWMLQRITVTRASLVGYLVPLVAVVAGVLVLGEQLAPAILAGGLLILIGVILVDRLERRLPVATTT